MDFELLLLLVLPSTLRSCWETRIPSVSVNYVANVITREKFKEVLSNLDFSNNEETLAP